ncbi:Calmodulin isoform 2 [Schistosoma japonicum]|uniref:Calmodulin isoform 2 n=1 Tax=Schistosoma japonicum TaxID=6182 RepID=A0A4Z2DM94_SCHJA|nr:Calmodulin [Schistosoma japonicum]TNN17259.1 Calmodulin isoform 2 [Schistosoma japonicum]TNN17260.1 Calmodulin isoform 2 [Schistosoma japonicum]
MVSKDVLLDIFYTELSQAFRHIDKDGDGLLGVDDISNLLTKLGIGVNESSISNVVRSLSDGEVFIRLPLFIELVGRSLDNLDDNQPVRTLFRILDRNGDGHLDSDEIAFRMSKIFDKITKEEVTLLLDSISLEEDQKLNCVEFGALLRSGFLEAMKRMNEV